MPKNKSDDEFVTKTECGQRMTGFQDDLATVRKAIIGDDMRGGMVRDIAEIKSKVKNGGNGGLGKRERAMIYVSLIGSGGLIIVETIKIFFH